MDIIIDQTKIKTKGKKTKKSHSFKKKKAKSILVQHGGRNYDFNNLIGIKSEGQMSCSFDSGIQMLWNIDCLHTYLLDTHENAIRNLTLMTKPDIETNKQQEENRFTKLFEKNYADLYKNITSKKFSLTFNLTNIKHEKVDTIETKRNMILALKRIIIAYYNKVDYVKDHQLKHNEIQALLKDPKFTNDTRNFTHKLLEHEFFVDMTKKIFKYTKQDKTSDTNPVTDFLNYVRSRDGDREKVDPIKFIELIFLLFEDIKAYDVITLIKCFRCGILNIDQQKNLYEIIYRNTIEIIIVDDNTNLQDNINKTYINSDNTRLLLFPETKFILIEIMRTVEKLQVKANAIIDITGNNYILRGCIVVAPGHTTFIAYNDEGEKAALLNGTMITDLTTIKEDQYNDHLGNKEEYNPDLNGVLYLYERIDGPITAVVANDADVAPALAASLAAATVAGTEDIIEPDIAASALTATLAATQVADSIPVVPSPAGPPADPPAGPAKAAPVGPAKAAPAAPPADPAKAAPPVIPPADPAKAVPPVIPPADPAKAAPAGPPAGPPAAHPKGAPPVSPPADPAKGAPTDPSLATKAPPPEGTTEIDTIRQQSLASGSKSKEPVIDNPYSGSLEPSGDSNGENMVLGVLLVITIAISGVLFVQR